MPYVSISTAKGILDVEQKRTLLQRITDLMVEIEGQGNPEFRKLVWVKIEEEDLRRYYRKNLERYTDESTV